MAVFAAARELIKPRATRAASSRCVEREEQEPAKRRLGALGASSNSRRTIAISAVEIDALSLQASGYRATN